MGKAKILVIRGGAIGDFILTLPVLAALRQNFPNSHLEVLGYPHIVQLAVAGGIAHRAQPIEARNLALFFARDGTLPDDQRDYFSEFDLIVSFLYDPDEIFRTNIARCSPAQFIAGPHRAEEREGIHAAQIYLNALTRLAIFDADTVPRLSLEPTAAPLRQVAFHPGSGSERKNWPESRWAEFLKRVAEETDLQLLLVGGEAEGDRLARLSAALPSERIQVARNLPLTELARRLTACVGFVGHDSGITHLAAALGLPCLVLWADTAEDVWRPQGERVSIIREAQGIHRLTSERVFQELSTMLSPASQRR